MDINLMLEMAITELKNIDIGETFTLKDLFKGYAWNRIKQGEKSTLGTLFLNYAKSNENIQIIENKLGQKKYTLKSKKFWIFTAKWQK